MYWVFKWIRIKKNFQIFRNSILWISRQFYFELCRRFQKLSFLIAEEPMKSRLAGANAKEMINKTQVVQNVKYVVRWPDGVEPSMRGLNQEDLQSELYKN